MTLTSPMIAIDAPLDPNQPLPLSQSPAYAATLRTMGQPVWQARVDGAQALISPVFGAQATIRGPVWDAGLAPCPDIRATVLRRMGLRVVEADPAGTTPADPTLAALRLAGFARVVTPMHVAEWSLGTAAARRAALHGKWRNALVQGEAAGLTIREEPFTAAPDHWMFREVRALARARRFRTLPFAFTRAFVAANPGAARLWSAWDGTTPLAGIVVLRHGPVATYHHGWTGDAGRAARAHHVLLWQAADWLAARGTTHLDLGCIDTETAPGLARFKLGTGATARPLGGSWLRLPGLAQILTARALVSGRA